MWYAFFILFDMFVFFFFFFFQAEDGIRDLYVTGVQTCALPIWATHVTDRDGHREFPAFGLREAPRGHPLTDQIQLRLAHRAFQPQQQPVVVETRRSEEHTSELQSRRDLVCRL